MNSAMRVNVADRREDRELIAACLEGDHEAWEELITRYRRLIYSIPLKSGLSPDDAADIFQHVCLKLYEKLGSVRDHEKLSSWLITATTRECWRMAARNRREGPPPTTDHDEEGSGFDEIPAAGLLPDEQRELIERQEAVRQGVAALGGRCTDLITMLFYEKEDLSYAEIARRMAMPVASIGPTRARCLEKLKKLLQGKI
jgi:RNA polymerase sigma factor (sigma-70 family)